MVKKKKKTKNKMSLGGAMMPMDQKRKVNPTTGMAMKGGGWVTKNNKLKTGMAKGGMARNR